MSDAKRRATFVALVPGLAAAGAVAAAAFALRTLSLPGLQLMSPLLLAIVIGMTLGNVFGIAGAARPGLAFSLRAPLRIGIALLGLQITFSQIAGIGVAGLLIIGFAVVGTFAVVVRVGTMLGVDPKLARLIAAGTAICGASAIIAANTVVRDRDEAVAYSLATVTLFGTVSMFAYPLLGALLPLDDLAYGLWVGASVHEVAQVVAAAFAHGPASGEFGTIAKLARVLMLAPMVVGLGYLLARREATLGRPAAAVPVPWFVLGFMAMVVLASTGLAADGLRHSVALTAQVLLALALAAVGLETNLRRVVAQGWRPLLLGGLGTLFIGGSTLALALLWHA
jgi:uncharacterized integral membrane protein (TIGR00698 family)